MEEDVSDTTSDDDSDDENSSSSSSSTKRSKHGTFSNASHKHLFRVDHNTIYLRGDITVNLVVSLNIMLMRMSRELQVYAWSKGKQYSDEIITVYIHSGGGDLVAGLSAADNIATCGVTVDTVIDGEACSAATLLSVAATGTSWIMPHATMLVHQLSGGMLGKHTDMKDEISNCDKISHVMRGLYLENCKGLSKKKLKTMLANEVCMTAKEAVKLGFCDYVYTNN
jgi:ATP-dependent protease ClpP protease subunit